MTDGIHLTPDQVLACLCGIFVLVGGIIYLYERKIRRMQGEKD